MLNTKKLSNPSSWDAKKQYNVGDDAVGNKMTYNWIYCTFSVMEGVFYIYCYNAYRYLKNSNALFENDK